MMYQDTIARKPGKVWLVGAGAGDEELMTLKGLAALQQADVVIYDALINRRILRHCPPGAEKIFVGKRAGIPCMTQNEINSLLVKKARSGCKVVRLKGGDPFIFGRGGEEALTLRECGLEFEIIPGVTAALAAAAYAGIPLTLRGVASSVTLVTGHEAESAASDTGEVDRQESKPDWDSLAKASGTLVVYMGLKNLSRIVSRLKSGGRTGDTPAAIILWGTLNEQKTITGVLDNIEELVQNAGLFSAHEQTSALAPAALLIIGNVVEYGARLTWFEKKPLKGLRVMITRSHEQKGMLYDRLYAAGASVIEFPTLEIRPIKENVALDTAFRQLDSYNWLIFSSVNTVQLVLKRFWELGYDLRRLMHIKLAAIGRQTEQALKEFHLRADLVPADYSSASLLEAFKDYFKAKQISFKDISFLFPGSSLVSDILPGELVQLGARVASIPVYENNLPVYSAEEFARCWKPLPDLVVFTSSSTVIHLSQLLTRYHQDDFLPALKAAVIGPVTAQTARSLNIPVVVEPAVHTSDDLVEAIINFYNQKVVKKITV